MSLIPSGRQRREDQEFEASLLYISSSRTARAKQRDERLKSEDQEIQDDLSYILRLRTA